MKYQRELSVGTSFIFSSKMCSNCIKGLRTTFLKIMSKNNIYWSVFLLLIMGAILLRCSDKKHQPIAEDMLELRKTVLKNNLKFQLQVQRMIDEIPQIAENQKRVKQFDSLRMTYKAMEWAVEYFMPHTARFMNGPAIPEIEFNENIVLEPEGLQVLEELMYDASHVDEQEIIRQLKLLLNKSGTIDNYFQTITINREQAFDAIRNQVYRISTLGLSGFDTPTSANHLREMIVSLQSVRTVLGFLAQYSSDENAQKINTHIDDALSFLHRNTDKNSFDFATFLVQHIHAISSTLIDFKKEQNIGSVDIVTALKKTARTLFEVNAFDVNAFIPEPKYAISDAKIALGKQLFHDNLLSEGNSRSCATCHHPDKAFTDGLEKSLSLTNNPLQRNAPSLNYSALQHGQFWDMRSEDLEGQSSDVITNKDEMHGNLDLIIKKINENETYRKAFQKIYSSEAVVLWQLQNVLASYIRSLAKFSSPFDDFMRGKSHAITQRQKEGFNLFMGKANCASCHFLPVFNGTVPPDFVKTEQEVLGVAENSKNQRLSADLGRGKYYPTVASLQNSFKTPTVRNASKTAPYMHNGGYATLREVMDFYNQGGGKGLGLKVANQTLSEDPLLLSEDEIEKIIEFMHALEDK